MSCSSKIYEVSIRISVLGNITKEKRNLNEVKGQTKVSMQVGSLFSLCTGQPSLWLVATCTMPVNPLGTFLCWLVFISPYAKSILCPTLPWEADLHALYNLDFIALRLWLSMESERSGRRVRLRGERDWDIYSLCCLSAPPQFQQGQCSSITTAPVRKPSVAVALARSW